MPFVLWGYNLVVTNDTKVNHGNTKAETEATVAISLEAAAYKWWLALLASMEATQLTKKMAVEAVIVFFEAFVQQESLVVGIKAKTNEAQAE